MADRWAEEVKTGRETVVGQTCGWRGHQGKIHNDKYRPITELNNSSYMLDYGKTTERKKTKKDQKKHGDL